MHNTRIIRKCKQISNRWKKSLCIFHCVSYVIIKVWNMLHKNQQVCYGCSCKFTYTSNMYLHYGPRTYITGSEYTKPRRIAQNRPVDYGLYTVCGIWGMYRIMDLRVAPVCVPAHALSIRVCYALWLATRLRKLGRSHLENPRGDWFGSPASSLSLSLSLFLSLSIYLPIPFSDPRRIIEKSEIKSFRIEIGRIYTFHLRIKRYFLVST